MLKSKITMKNIICVMILILITLLSITIAAKYASSPDVHASSIQMLDEKKTKAMELTAAVTITSTAITAIPGDVATPIAEQVSQLASYLLIAICAIYLEKFLLTITGYISFTYLIPIVCLLFAFFLFTQKKIWKSIAINLLIFALAIVAIIPFSLKVTNLIENTFEESISETYQSVELIADEAEKSSENEDENSFWNFLTGVADGITNMAESAKQSLSVFVDAIAVLIITTCVIPIVVILLFFWLIKLLFGLNLSLSSWKKKSNGKELLSE